MTGDREFVSTTGTRSTSCGRVADLSNPVVQGWVKDCKRCYPKGGK